MVVVVVVVVVVEEGVVVVVVVVVAPLDSPETPREIPLNHRRRWHMSGGISSQHTPFTSSPPPHNISTTRY